MNSFRLNCVKLRTAAGCNTRSRMGSVFLVLLLNHALTLTLTPVVPQVSGGEYE